VNYPGGKNMKSDLIVIGDLPTQKKKKWSHCNGWPTQMEKNGLIVMDDLPRWKIWMWSHCNSWFTHMENINTVLFENNLKSFEGMIW